MKKWLVLGAAALAFYAGGKHEITAATAAHIPVTRNANEALANQMAASGYGWTGSETMCLDELWTEESGFDASAVNNSSGATGIPQLNPSAHSIPPDWSNPATQVRWGLRYVKDTYGTPCRAWSFETSHSPNWY